MPGVDEADNDAFLDLMESYFGLSDEDKMRDTRPQYSYQVRSPGCGGEG